MSKYRDFKTGVTMMELIIALAVFGLLGFMAISAISRFRASSLLQATHAEIGQAFSEARNLTLASEKDTVYGVHVDSYRIVRFVGSTYASTTSTNKPYVFDPRVVVATSSFAGGSNVVFKRLTGATNNSGYVVIKLVNNNARRATTTILSSGIIQ
jgi:prepilin-type N-terminal cleavage/methylation domain-containing protein